jgi:hypothetical protein
MSDLNYPMCVSVVVNSPEQLRSVYAVLAGVSLNVITYPAPVVPASAGNGASSDAPKATAAPSAPAATPEASPAPASTSTTATSIASHTDDADAIELDRDGWPWSAEMHASTKGKTKEGLWRMKAGVERPAPKPGFPKDETGATGTASAASSSAGNSANAASASPATTEDDDEFAAFRQALGNEANAGAAAEIPERKWTDADLGALCNQAAVKLGDPAPIKALIEQFVPAGTVPHSRNVPQDKRAEFAAAVEKKADIVFDG